MSSIVITGSNRGLGLEFAHQYAEAGWRVYACCRDPNNAQALHALKEQHNKLSVHGMDVRDHHQIDVLAKDLAEESLDIVLNNAGVFYKDSEHFGGLSYEIWLDSFRINTLASAKMAEAFVTHVARSEKKLFVAITSLMGSMEDNGSGGYYPYRSSKAALNAVMKSLAIDLKPRKIGALLLHPGWVKTTMGGEHAEITPQESVRGMRKVINDFKLRNSGRFFNYQGKKLPW
jgi:NAD(P)-dependent dehydrogenase (short-subunit alcohol dehydrogenase family)